MGNTIEFGGSCDVIGNGQRSMVVKEDYSTNIKN